MTRAYVKFLSEIELSSLMLVGGKNASLGELYTGLKSAGVQVPDGFALTADAFRLHLREAGIADSIYKALDNLDIGNVARLSTVAREIRENVSSAPLPAPVQAELLEAYAELSRRYAGKDVEVAVRSSATAEDLPSASFAGQHETFLNVRGEQNLLVAVRQ